MTTLTEYFETEARDYLAQLDRDLERPRPDVAGLHRLSRALRGSAQMARDERVVRAAGVLEAAARALADERIRWSDELAACARATVADLRVLVDRRHPAASLDALAASAVARWRNAGIDVPLAAPRAVPDAPASANREFRAFAAREVAAIAEALDRGVQQLSAVPMDREPLKMILRRQRALLGAARLDEIPVVAEILRAIDDLTRVIAKLDVGVKREWLDIYRIAREGLRATIQPLQQDQDPKPSHALSRLRHMREELLERYGAGEVVSAAHESAGLTQPTTVDRPTEAMEAHHAAAESGRLPAASESTVAPVVQRDEELLLDDVMPEVDELHDETAVLELDETASEGLLELDEPDDEGVLELDEPDDEGVLELDEPDDEGVLELDEPDDEGVLELDEVADEELLELDDIAERADVESGEVPDARMEPDELVLELDGDSIVATARETAAVLLEEVVDEPVAVSIESLLYDRDAALRRALELRDLVALSAIDPVTHEAIDELFDLIGIALR
jgi:hypothetical protein